MKYQIMRRADKSWDVYQLEYINGPQGADATKYDLIARIVLDPFKDRYFVERCKWNVLNHEFVRIERPYLTFQATFNAICNPKPVD